VAFAKTEETAELDNGVNDFAADRLNFKMVNRTDLFAVAAVNGGAFDGLGGQKAVL
jgi:hypothetical protein